MPWKFLGISCNPSFGLCLPQTLHTLTWEIALECNDVRA